MGGLWHGFTHMRSYWDRTGACNLTQKKLLRANTFVLAPVSPDGLYPFITTIVGQSSPKIDPPGIQGSDELRGPLSFFYPGG